MVSGNSVWLVAIILTCYSAMMLVSSAPNMETHGLNAMATVDGKTFFYDKTFMNWTNAKLLCEGTGMQLATITTSAQLDLLLAYRVVTGNTGYWIGARDAQTPAQFVWDSNKGSLNASLFPNFKYETIQTCVLYSGADGIPSLHSSQCNAWYYVLCELVHN